jgi:hypothetical protein
MDTITQVRLPDGTTLTLGDWVDKPVYSMVDFLSGFSDPVIEAFGYNVGDVVPTTSNATVKRTSSERDTNIAAAGGNVSTEELLVYALKPEFFELQCDAAAATDMTTASPRLPGQPLMRPTTLGLIALTMNLRFKISEKVYADAGVQYYNSGFGIFGMGQLLSQAAAATARTYANQGWPGQDAVRSFAVPHHVGGTEKYTVEWRNWTSSQIVFIDEAEASIPRCAVSVRTYLDGMRKRPTA